MLNRILLTLLFSVGIGFSQSIPTQLQLQQPPPPAVTGLTANVVGNRGNQTYSYQVVANYPGGSVVSVPVVVQFAPASPSGGNYISVSWNALTGATNYDVIRMTPPAIFNGSTCTGCAVVTGTTNLVVSDNGGSLSSYTTAAAAPGATGTLYINNSLYAPPQLRQVINGVDLPVPSSSGSASLFTSYQFGSQTAITATGTYLQTTYPNIFSLAQTGSGTSGSPYVDAISLATETAHYVLVGPASGLPAASTFRSLAIADLPPNLSASNYAAGGGTAQAQTATYSPTPKSGDRPDALMDAIECEYRGRPHLFAQWPDCCANRQGWRCRTCSERSDHDGNSDRDVRRDQLGVAESADWHLPNMCGGIIPRRWHCPFRWIYPDSNEQCCESC